MQLQDIENALEDLMEELAAIEHERWSHWQRYVHSRCTRLGDGSLLIPPELAKQWAKQMDTRYDQLDERERESDREQVRRYLPLIVSALNAQDRPV